LSVRAIKRFMVEQEKKPQLPEIRADVRNAGRKVAVIGAGPAGLSCAYFLARLGYKPDVFEAHKEAGGMLVQTIPAYRLPREMLAKEVRMIKSMGVTIHAGQRLGRDFTLKGLREKGYEAVFVGVGAPLGAKLGIPGENTPGVVDGVEFLREYNLRGTAAVGRRVAVIGGGNVAVDVARTALRLGAESVTLLYRRTRDEMPAYKEEVDEALREGVKIEFLVAPTEIVGENGHVTGVRCTRMELGEFDRSGRRRPKERVGDEFEVEADQAIGAIGQALHPEEIVDGTGLKLGRTHYVDANPVTGQTSVEWIFAGGDAVTGPASVIAAIAAGERAAAGIDQYLTGSSHAFWRTEQTVDTAFDPDADPVSYGRPALRTIPVSRRKRSFQEVELPLSATAALREAKRCLRCDYREASHCEK
jgi:NADH-quinone oxidoreductase subunit F